MPTHTVNAKKRAVTAMLAALDEESEKGNVNEGAYLRLSKCLKHFHGLDLEVPADVLTRYFLHQLVTKPKGIPHMTDHVRTTVIEKAPFLRFLKKFRKKANPSGAGDEAWANDVLSALIPFEVHSPEDGDYARFGELVELVVKAREWLLPLERFLDDVDLYPSLVGPEPIGRGKMQAVPKLLTIEPAFVWWLLNPGTVDDFHWEDWEVVMLQEYAFKNRNKVYCPEYMPRLVAGLGLRGPDDLEAVAARMRDHGEIWAEAKEHVTHNSGDYCGTPMELPQRPHDGRYTWAI